MLGQRYVHAFVPAAATAAGRPLAFGWRRGAIPELGDALSSPGDSRGCVPAGPSDIPVGRGTEVPQVLRCKRLPQAGRMLPGPIPRAVPHPCSRAWVAARGENGLFADGYPTRELPGWGRPWDTSLGVDSNTAGQTSAAPRQRTMAGHAVLCRWPWGWPRWGTEPAWGYMGWAKGLLQS